MKAIVQKLDSQGRIVSTVQTLPTGAAGTQRTLALMHESIVEVQTHELVLSAAFVAAGLANRAASAKAEVARVQQWVQNNIRYVLDPLKVELLQSPDVTLRRKQGDCDDQTTLMCALLNALGYQCRMVAIGFAPGVYAHVYSEVNIEGVWTAAETIKPWPLGKEPTGVKATIRMIVNAESGASLSGFFKSILKPIKQIVKPIVSVQKEIFTQFVAKPVLSLAKPLVSVVAKPLVQAFVPSPSPTYTPAPDPIYAPAPEPIYTPPPAPVFTPPPAPVYAPTPAPTYYAPQPAPTPVPTPAPVAVEPYTPDTPVSPVPLTDVVATAALPKVEASTSTSAASFIADNKIPLAIGGGVLVLTLAMALQRK